MSSVTVEQFASFVCDGLIDGFKDISGYETIYPNTPQHLLKQEFAALNLFQMLITFSSYYKNKPLGIKIFNTVVDKYKEALVDMKLFTDLSSCNKFIETRLVAYKDILERHQNDNYLKPLSFKINDFFGGDNVSQAVGVISIYTGMIEVNIKFIREMDTKMIIEE